MKLAYSSSRRYCDYYCCLPLNRETLFSTSSDSLLAGCGDGERGRDEDAHAPESISFFDDPDDAKE